MADEELLWDSDADEEEDPVVMMRGHDLIASSTLGGLGFDEQNGPLTDARFLEPTALLRLPDGCVLVGDRHCVRKISARIQEVTMVGGSGDGGFRDGAAAQARFRWVRSLLLLPDGRVLVADSGNHRIRILSANLQQVRTVAGNDEHGGYRDGTATQACFRFPTGLALLPDGRVLVADQENHRIRMLSVDLQQVSTVAGDFLGFYDGAAAQACFRFPTGLALLPDGRVLVADQENHRIRMLSVDLQQVSTVAGDGMKRHRDGMAMRAALGQPRNLAVLPDGRVLVSTFTSGIRILSADLQQVHTVLREDGSFDPFDILLLSGGRVFVGSKHSSIRMLAGLATPMGVKPAAKPPKRLFDLLATNGAGASSSSDSGGGTSMPLSSGPALKRGRSGAR